MLDAPYDEWGHGQIVIALFQTVNNRERDYSQPIVVLDSAATLVGRQNED
jgi:hypothetical protein